MGLDQGEKRNFHLPPNHDDVVFHFKVSDGQLDATHGPHPLLIAAASVTNELDLWVCPCPFLKLLLIGRIHLQHTTSLSR